MTETWEPARILVVDDEPGMLRAVARVLERDYAVECCQDPLQAPQQAGGFQPDIALLDIRMPGMDGFTLMRRLLQDNAALDVILMTGNFDEADADLIQAIDDGAFYYLQKPIDRRVLLALVSRCVERRRLQQQQRRHLQRMENELQHARCFQQSLLPPPSARQHGFEVEAWFQPCHELAGDVYDYAFLGPERLALLVADVMGHGAAAAMLTGLVKSSFQAALSPAFDPLHMISRLHAALASFEEGLFVTVFAAHWIGGAESRLEYANAGHPPPLLLGRSACRLLESTGPIVASVFTADLYQATSVAVEHDAVLLAYSDGLTDQSRDQQLFSRQRLQHAATASLIANRPLAPAIHQAWREFAGDQPPQDDITVLTARRCPSGAGASVRPD